jgi:hypothetical protein
VFVFCCGHTLGRASQLRCSGLIARDPDGHADLIARYTRTAGRGPTIH